MNYKENVPAISTDLYSEIFQWLFTSLHKKIKK